LKTYLGLEGGSPFFKQIPVLLRKTKSAIILDYYHLW
jgi:formylmethanofuran dehydrogenase subunit D